MPDIPNFFNKADFFGKLLPGYLAVVLFLVLFKSDLLVSQENGISADLLLAVVVIVAGPALGLGIQLFHRHLYSIWGQLTRSSKRSTEIDDIARIRLLCSNDERFELEKAEADYDFSISTALVLAILGAYHFATLGTFAVHIPAILFLVAGVFLLGAYYERLESYGPIARELMRKYPRPSEIRQEPYGLEP